MTLIAIRKNVKSGENLTWNTRKNMTERDICKERQN